MLSLNLSSSCSESSHPEGQYQWYETLRISLLMNVDHAMHDEVVPVNLLEDSRSWCPAILLHPFLPLVPANEDGDVSDDNWHGTFLAGLIAGFPLSEYSLASANTATKNVRLMPIKVLDTDMQGSASAVLEGHGARSPSTRCAHRHGFHRPIQRRCRQGAA